MGLTLLMVCADLDPGVDFVSGIVGVGPDANVWCPLIIALLASDDVSSHAVECILHARWTDLPGHQTESH